MAQLTKKFLANNAVDGTKLRLNNNENIKARNAADSADVNILKVNASDRIEFASIPQSTSDAVANNDLVRYSQLAALTDGLKPKAAVRVATTVAGTLATSFENGDTIDGVVLATSDRILIKDQTLPEENGIYVVAATGAPTRATDFDSPSEIPGAYTVAQFGTANQGVLFVSLSSPGTIGTDPIQFAARAITTYTGGDMITLSSGAFSVDLATTSGLESTNAGNAAGQLRVKLEASNPTLLIDGSNQLGVKLNAAGAIATGASGLATQVDNSTVEINTNALRVKDLGITLGKLASASVDENKIVSTTISTTGALNGGSGTKLSARVDTATVKINGSNNLEALKDQAQQITLSGTDITNQYVDLSFSARSASTIALTVIGGIAQNRGVDYTVSLTGGSGGVTRITFAGDLATGGAAALVATDILLITYEYL